MGMGGAWAGERWDASTVEKGQLVLMPTMRFAVLHTEEADGRRTFITPDGSCLLCCHGEKGSTVGTWCQEEKVASQSGVPPKPRKSCCDCQTARGLFSQEIALPPGTPPVPESIFDYLVNIDAPSIMAKGREARQLPYTSGDQATFLTSFGALVCRHGKRRNTLMDARRGKSSPPKCSCTPVAFPTRSTGVKLGRYEGKVPPKRQREGNADCARIGQCARRAEVCGHVEECEECEECDRGDQAGDEHRPPLTEQQQHRRDQQPQPHDTHPTERDHPLEPIVV